MTDRSIGFKYNPSSNVWVVFKSMCKIRFENLPQAAGAGKHFEESGTACDVIEWCECEFSNLHCYTHTLLCTHMWELQFKHSYSERRSLPYVGWDNQVRYLWCSLHLFYPNKQRLATSHTYYGSQYVSKENLNIVCYIFQSNSKIGGNTKRNSKT